MTDRNDELLLALGWQQTWRRHGVPGDRYDVEMWYDRRGKKYSHYQPEEKIWPRPYDNLQDAMDCVPKGWIVGTLGDSELGHWFCKLVHQSAERPHVRSRADTPAEALSEAILKTMEANKEIIQGSVGKEIVG